MKRSRGLRSQTRHKFSRSVRERGLSPITRTLQTFNTDESVNIVIDPSIQKGQPHHRFHGLTGKVQGGQGKSWRVSVRVGNCYKEVIARPEHLRRVK